MRTSTPRSVRPWSTYCFRHRHIHSSWCPESVTRPLPKKCVLVITNVRPLQPTLAPTRAYVCECVPGYHLSAVRSLPPRVPPSSLPERPVAVMLRLRAHVSADPRTKVPQTPLSAPSAGRAPSDRRSELVRACAAVRSAPRRDDVVLVLLCMYV